jgi:putative ABC transport system permease protein
LVAGRLLSRAQAQDTFPPRGTDGGGNIVVEVNAARRFGFTPQQAIGKTVRWGSRAATIVGVVADSLVHGPQDTLLPPMIFSYRPRDMTALSIRARTGRLAEALIAVDRDWRRFAPNLALQRHFLDDTFERLLRADQQRGRIFTVSVVLAILIACLGLYGLAAFTAARRTREIGIRKVFGARTRDVTLLLLWQLSVPVLIANAIAWPIAWYYLHGWLTGFAQRIALSPLYFLAAGAAALVIAWATVFAHALRIARANPIHALRHE